MKYNFEIRKIHKVKATEFIQSYHYSPVMPRLTKHFLGFFLRNELKGVLTLGWGTQPRQTINKMFPGLESKDYYEIGKMCLSPDLNETKSAGSQMVSATIGWMKKNTNCLFLYTMADGIMGKCGYVYQASNFYFGEKYWTPVYLMENGEKLHPRSTKDLCKENAIFSGKEKIFWMTSDFMKYKGIKKIHGYMFRYIYPLNKKAKKLMKNKSTLKWGRGYPKDKDLEWIDVTDRKNKFTIPKPAFTFEDAIYNLKNMNAHVNTNTLEKFMIEPEQKDVLAYFKGVIE
jgi:hypothetical protein